MRRRSITTSASGKVAEKKVERGATPNYAENLPMIYFRAGNFFMQAVDAKQMSKT
jgi:hypothetical protein